MPSEVVIKEAEIAVEGKDTMEKIITKTETKTNGSEESKTEEMDTVDVSEESKVAEDELSESENKENEEPTVEDITLQKKRAEELLTEGKRSIIIKDFQAAVDALSEACSLFGTIYSELAEECAEPYFYYGWALLELSKNQISPVGLGEKDEEENEVETEEVESNNEGNKSSVSDVADEVKETDNVENKSTEKEENLPEVTSVDDEENEVEGQSTEKDENSGNEEEKPDGEDVEEDDVNDLQISWEMLDLAKVIYKNKATEESKLKLAEVLMKCGEVSIEDEKFDTAIQDITESLEIRR